MHAPASPSIDEDEVRGPHWVSRAAFPIVFLTFVLNQLLLGLALYGNRYGCACLLVLTASHLMHGLLIAFHESAHGLLRGSRRLNDLDGLLLGIFSFTSFSLYQAAHQSHHAHLATPRDEELWPFVIPSMARWRRRLAAFLELNLGIFFTPYLFYRTFLRRGSPIRNKKVRQRIWMEVAIIATFWLALLSYDAWFGLWKYFFWMYLAPALIAGNLQSWRKYIEHVGLTGSTINSATRSIVAEGLLGRFISFTLLHEPYHGVHHRFSGLPHAELPAHVEVIQPQVPDDPAPYPSYLHALGHLLRNLADPRVGAQWHPATGAAGVPQPD